MTEPDRLADGAERLFDVVLREQCARDAVDAGVRAVLGSDAAAREQAWRRARAADGASTSRSPRMLPFAAALLGLAVVAITMWGRGGVVRPAGEGPQDPAVRQQIEPRDRAHFLQLLAGTTAIRVSAAQIVGATPRVLANGAADVLDLAPLAPIERIEGEAVAAWREQFAASAKRGASQLPLQYAWTCWFELADGREMQASWGAHTGARIRVAANDDGIDANEALSRLLFDAQGAVLRRHRQSIGKADDVDELAALPADSRRLECPWFADGRMAERLARFTNLETFVLAKGPGAGLDAAGLRELVAKRTLTTLDLRAAELAPRDLALLAELPTLTSLALRGAPAPGQPIAQFAPNLTELTLERCRMSGADGFFLRGCKRLKLLQVLDCDITASTSWVEISSLPSLTQLIVRQKERPERLFEALQLSKLQSLRLVDMPVAGGDLAMLAELPTLRELAVLAPTIDDGEAGNLAALKQLTTLRLMNVKLTPDGLADLAKALPKCTIDCVPGRRVFDSGTWILP